MTATQVAASVLLSIAPAGGAGGQGLLGGTTAAPAGGPASMNGRWLLSAPNAPACGVTFNGADGAREGKIAPEGGCPGKFFMSRNWSLDQNVLAINDHENNLLAKLTFANGRFEGQSAAGVPVTLAR
jgi:hypothetical protein